jgi:hypothetical protein
VKEEGSYWWDWEEPSYQTESMEKADDISLLVLRRLELSSSGDIVITV